MKYLYLRNYYHRKKTLWSRQRIFFHWLEMTSWGWDDLSGVDRPINGYHTWYHARTWEVREKKGKLLRVWLLSSRAQRALIEYALVPISLMVLMAIMLNLWYLYVTHQYDDTGIQHATYILSVWYLFLLIYLFSWRCCDFRCKMSSWLSDLLSFLLGSFFYTKYSQDFIDKSTYVNVHDQVKLFSLCVMSVFTMHQLMMLWNS